MNRKFIIGLLMAVWGNMLSGQLETPFQIGCGGFAVVGCILLAWGLLEMRRSKSKPPL
ncbi:MAG TPA: hypothetical protein VMB21_20460 [Candidatus Limnocylindria bacterium]|jgi:hypothetical protein|nr:hypothetical protein [Candidatus Limnocylindria bacterium]